MNCTSRMFVRISATTLTMIGVLLTGPQFAGVALAGKAIPILAPLAEGGKAKTPRAPSDEEVIQAFCDRHDDPDFDLANCQGVYVAKRLVTTRVDPPRTYPLIGRAQHHHAYYRCRVSFCYGDREDTFIFRVDHNHLHPIADTDANKKEATSVPRKGHR